MTHSNPEEKINRLLDQKGVTLVEVMVAMIILGFSALGILTGLMQARRYTELAIHENTALNIAQGYIEQIKNMEFASLDETVLPTLFHEGVEDTLNVSPLPADPVVGDTSTDVKNGKLIDVNNTPGDTSDDMSLDVIIYIEDITDPSSKIGQARRIILRYESSFTDGYRVLNQSDLLYAIRSEIPTF